MIFCLPLSSNPLIAYTVLALLPSTISAPVFLYISKWPPIKSAWMWVRITNLILAFLDFARFLKKLLQIRIVHVIIHVTYRVDYNCLLFRLYVIWELSKTCKLELLEEKVFVLIWRLNRIKISWCLLHFNLILIFTNILIT